MRRRISIKHQRIILKIYKNTKKNNVKGIYKITCVENGNFYVGSSSNIGARWKVHRLNLRKNCHHNYKLNNDVKKYGIKSFKFEILLSCSKEMGKEELLAFEQKFVDDLMPFYNIKLDISRVRKSVTGTKKRRKKLT